MVHTDKEIHAAYHRRYRAENRERLAEYERERYELTKKEVQCICGMTVLNKCLKKHLERKLHKNRMKQAEQIAGES